MSCWRSLRRRSGDIIALTGLDDVTIGDAITHPDHPVQPERVPVDEPTVQVTFSPNTSPFAGQDGRYLTSRQIGDRLKRELLTNVALRVEELGGEQYRVAGRGELHLSILIETLRRDRRSETVPAGSIRISAGATVPRPTSPSAKGSPVRS